jgi:putative heme-binding domain-containing protein
VSHARAQCIRCHKIEGQGGDAGPDLTKVAARGERAHLLESLIVPSAKIAAGFGTVTLELDDGRVITGVLLAEDDKELQLAPPRGPTIRIAKGTIQDRSAVVSPMPAAGEVLRLEELRDLMEFLSSRK